MVVPNHQHTQPLFTRPGGAIYTNVYKNYIGPHKQLKYTLI